MMRSDTTFKAIHHVAPNSMEKKCVGLVRGNREEPKYYC
jgi:hypothetical protein